MQNQKLPKSERLSDEKLIKALFSKSSATLFSYPFKIIYLPQKASNEPFIFPQIMVSVSKKSFKRANVRNLVRRRIKEAYRLHKSIFFTPENPFQIQCLGILYVAKEVLDYATIERKLLQLLKNFRTLKTPEPSAKP